MRFAGKSGIGGLVLPISTLILMCTAVAVKAQTGASWPAQATPFSPPVDGPPLPRSRAPLLTLA